MPSTSRTSRVYKDITLQQLRSFHETARLGSLTSAAAALNVSQPTVWKQVHALERQFGAQLVESHRRGSRLTKVGEHLAELVGPALESISTLKHRLQEILGQIQSRITVIATPRILMEELPECVAEFERRYPHVRLVLEERRVEDILPAIEAGEGDVGLTTYLWPEQPSPLLILEPGYEIDILLLTPKGHTLARRRHVRPKDLVGFPLVNSPESLRYPGIVAAMAKYGLFRDQTPRVETVYIPLIRRYVEEGFGIGIVAGRISHRPPARLHERSMSRYFGRIPVFLVWRRRPLAHEPAALFAETVKTMLKSGRCP